MSKRSGVSWGRHTTRERCAYRPPRGEDQVRPAFGGGEGTTTKTKKKERPKRRLYVYIIS